MKQRRRHKNQSQISTASKDEVETDGGRTRPIASPSSQITQSVIKLHYSQAKLQSRKTADRAEAAAVDQVFVAS